MIITYLSKRMIKGKKRGMRRWFSRTLLLSLSLAVVFSIMSILISMQEERVSVLMGSSCYPLSARTDDLKLVQSLYPGKKVFLYGEEVALIDGNAMVIRYADDAFSSDNLMLFSGDDSALVVSPYSLGRSSDEVNLLRMAGHRIDNLDVQKSGYFFSQNHDVEERYAFLPLSYCPEGIALNVAILDSYDAGPLEERNIDYFTWKDSEIDLYSALVLERFLIFFILFFLFFVIYLSSRNSVRSFVFEKRKERLSLSVMGMGRKGIELTYLLSFLFYDILALLFSIVISIMLLSFSRSFLFLSNPPDLSIPFIVILSLFFLLMRVFDIHQILKKTEVDVRHAN